MTAHREEFSVGTPVRVVSKNELEEFKREWKAHDPLTDEQIVCADQVFRVKQTGIYFGGNVIYQLEDAPGVWHERCLRQADLRK